MTYPIVGSSYEISFAETLAGIETDWDAHAGSSTFMQSPFLKALEAAPPSGTRYRYGIVSEVGKTVGIIYYQLKYIDLAESLRLDTVSTKGLWQSLKLAVKKLLARQVSYYTLVVGNMTLTGTYGHHLPSIVDTAKWQILSDAATKLCEVLKTEGISVRGVLHKDYSVHNKPAEAPAACTSFSVQPNMLLHLPADWTSFDDYLSAMRSKYRVRVRRARKKAEGLTRRQLTTEEVRLHSNTISELYKNVAHGAGFNLFILPEDYFYHLCLHLEQKMKLTAYFDGDEMVGFYTSIQNDKELDAHFLGYEPTCNNECQLYLNMLYDLVEEAIDYRAPSLVLSRTAMEIKSSIGAEAEEMYLYMMATGSLANKILPKALDYFVPATEWTPRSPFPKG